MLGVVGDGAAGEQLVDRLREAGATIATGEAAAVLNRDPAVVIADGEAGLVDLVQAGVDVPVLPIGAEWRLPSWEVEDIASAVNQLHDGDFETLSHRMLAVDAAGTAVGPAAFDVLLVRSEPGRISEYSLAGDGTRSRFRADGVVAATPAGSHGYPCAAGAPRLALDAGAFAVVPVAAFGLGAPTWVVDFDGGATLRIERDEGDVSVVVDGRKRRQLTGEATVRLAPGGTLRTVMLSRE